MQGRRDRHRLDGRLARARHRHGVPVDPAHQRRRRGTASEAGRLRHAASPAAIVPPAEGDGAEPFVEPVIRSWTWWQSGGLEFAHRPAHRRPGGDAAVARRVHLAAGADLLSLEYVRGDRRYTHFFAAITLFSAGMLVMVLAENMVQLILGWEIMGLCSFMLIGHWWEEEANARAALKAFFTVRVGDVGLLVGTAILFFGANQWAQDNLDTQRLQHPGHPGLGAVRRGQPAPCCCGRRRPVHRLHRQARPVPAAHLAARRHGRPDAGVVAAALLDDGRGRRVPRRPALPGVLGGLQRSPTSASTSSPSSAAITIVIAAAAGVRAERHQEGARLLDGRPARLHDARPRRRRLDCRPCSTSSPTPSSSAACSCAPARSATPARTTAST